MRNPTMRSTARPRILVIFILFILVILSELLLLSHCEGLHPSDDFLSRSLQAVHQESHAVVMEGPQALSASSRYEAASLALKTLVKPSLSSTRQSPLNDSGGPSEPRLPFDPFNTESASATTLDRHLSSRRKMFEVKLKREGHSKVLIRKKEFIRKVRMVDLPRTNLTVEDDRIIYYLHIHKSAGTTICGAAELNNMAVSEKNCNVQIDQRCCGHDDSLQGQQDFAKSTEYEFVANEQDMYTAMDTEHYRYVVMLRDSRDRYMSHWKHVYRNHRKEYNVEGFTEWCSGQPDNWNVRKICGTPCMETPKYGLTEHLWNQTLARLSQFDDVMFLDRFNETYTQFANRVGWRKMPVHQPTAPNNKAKAVEYPTIHDEWDPFMSALDDALREFAESMYRGEKPNPYSPSFSVERQEALTRYFAKGKLAECDNPCCAEICSKY